jgi:streptogramin lyase
MISGSILGGRQPVTGASIQLYAAGTTGYGTGAQALLSTPIISDSTGKFSLTGSYTCPSASSLLYLVATGGNPGLSSGSSNPKLAMMTAIGQCGTYSGKLTLDPTSTIAINEITTVASVFALSHFLDSTATKVGTSATNLTGLANAFKTVQNLANTSTGISLATTPAGNGTSPQTKLNTLADIIASCINSDGTGSTCTTLISATTPTAGTAPTNTLQALLNIALHPSYQAATLFSLVTAIAPYAPAISVTPRDWALRIAYGFGNLPLALNLGIDAAGDIWLLNQGYGASTPALLTELNNNGAVLSGSGYSAGSVVYGNGMSLDPNGDVWVTGTQPAAVAKISNNGSTLISAVSLPSNLLEPVDVAADGSGNAWIVNASSSGSSPSLFKLSTSGVNLSGAQGFGSGGLASPGKVAIDGAGKAWLGGSLSTMISQFSSTGSLLSGSGYSGAGLQATPFSSPIAIDNTGSAWISSTSTNTAQVARFSSTGSTLSGASGYPSCVLQDVSPYVCVGALPIAIDGAGHAFTEALYQYLIRGRVSQTLNGIVELDGTGAIVSGKMGYDTENLDSAPALQVDSSGNLWGTAGSYVFEIVGVATPAVTPLSAAAHDQKLGLRP